jgi:hypothetical protein
LGKERTTRVALLQADQRRRLYKEAGQAMPVMLGAPDMRI